MWEIFLLALGAAFYPTLLAIVIVVLGRPRPARLLAAYLAGGMLAGLGVGFLLVFVLKGVGVDAPSDNRSTASAIINILTGLFCLGIALTLLRGRDPRPARLKRKQRAPHDPKKKSWTQRAISHDSLSVAFGLGVVLDLPSIWYLLALKDIAAGGYSSAEEVLLIVAFNLIMFTVIEIPLVAYLLTPEKAAAKVADFNSWLHSHARQITEGVAGVLGLYLVVRGVVAL
jgi:MFS family permease